MNRPKLDKNISIKNFRNYYWLKEELVRFCREVGINSNCGKIEISNRIIKYLESSEIITKPNLKRKKPTSNFDWKNEILDIDTIITDNYKNTENVRAFFKHKIGSHFKFNVEFMDWMKVNEGKTLGDAINRWEEISELKKNKDYKTEIAPQFEYNTYIRDFLHDNPDLSVKDAIHCWQIKRDKPGIKKYEKGDLIYLTERERTPSRTNTNMN